MKMRKLISVFALVVGLGLAGPSVVLSATQVSADGANEAIKSAEAAAKKAASVKSEWRDTGKLIKKAKAAVKEGDYGTALKLAKKAEAEGHLGYSQGLAQKDLRLPAYLKY